ncbi:MAG: ComEC/Rec2 family competence protein [Bacteroidales bacterium]
MNWKQYPFIKLFLAFSTGIIIALNTHTPISYFYWIVILFTITSIAIFFTHRLLSYNYRWLAGAFITLFLIASGFVLCNTYNESGQSLYFSKVASDKGLFMVSISEPPEVKANSVKAVVKVKQCQVSHKWMNTSGSMIIYFQKDSLASSLHYGDLLIIHSLPNEIKPPQNPDEFNYKRYLAHKNIFHHSYIKQGEWVKLSSDNGNPLKAFATSLREKLLHIFEANNVSGREYAVISAILLGQTDKIDPELIKDYSGSGAIHVLSVSGMHVALIFLSLSILLSFLDKIKYGKPVKTFILLITVWFYALLTGMSPSVIRAATMISFIIIGKSLRRDADTLNILFASAFFILLFNPFLIADVGFQLSYLAVAGILIINEAITKWVTPSNYILNKLWETTAVSLSAQLVTTPLSMLYFHQFPNYFMLTNVVVFIFAAVVMYAGIFVILVSFIPYVSGFSAKILVYLVYGMNQSISFIEGLPYSVSRGINLSIMETLLFYMLIFAIIIMFFNKSRRYVLLVTSVTLLFFTSFSYKSLQQQQQRKFIVYAIPKTAAYEFMNGKKQLIITDTAMIKDDNKFGFHIQNHHTACGIHTKNFLAMDENTTNKALLMFKHHNFIQFGNLRIGIVNEWIKSECLPLKMKLDYLIVSNNVKAEMKDILKKYDAKLIIFDTSNAIWKTEKWEKECIALHQAFYNVVDKGAFVIEIK